LKNLHQKISINYHTFVDPRINREEFMKKRKEEGTWNVGIRFREIVAVTYYSAVMEYGWG